MPSMLKLAGIIGIFGLLNCTGPRPTECQQKEQVCYRRDIECTKRQLKLSQPLDECVLKKRECLTELTRAACILEGPLNGIGVWIFNNRTDYRLLENEMRLGHVTPLAPPAENTKAKK